MKSSSSSNNTGERKTSHIARGAMWMLSGQGIQMFAQFGYFLIIARVLGPAGYGTFIACTALAAIFAPFSPLGTGHVLMKHISRNPSLLPSYFGNTLLVTAGSGTVLAVLISLLRPLVLPKAVSAEMVAAVAIADLVCAQITVVCSQVFLATENPRKSARLLIVSACLRLAAVLILVVTKTATPMHWANFYAAASMLGAAFGVVTVSLSCAKPRLQWSLLLPSIREGFHFSTSIAAQTMYNDIDKTMLAKLSTVQSAAIYAVAYRFIEAAMLPIRSLQSVTYSEFFRQGSHGVTTAYRFAQRILRRSILYGAASSVVLWVAAGFLPKIMGSAYVESASALRWLCLLPLIKSVHSFLTDTLTGANFQSHRSWSQIAVAIFNVVINLWLIRVWSWRGAAWSSLATDGLLVVILYFIIRSHLRREKSEANALASFHQPVEEVAS